MQQLRTLLTTFQKDNEAQITKLRKDFELTLKNQDYRIQNLEKKITEQERIISDLQQSFSSVNSHESPSDNFILKQEENVNHIHKLTDEIAMSNVSSIKEEVRVSKNKDVQSLQSKEHKKYERKDRLLSPDVIAPGPVVAFYAYMSANLPANVATPHHVLIFDHVRTNIGNGYHPSTGVFIAPETGVYVFMWNFMNGGGSYHSTQLMINSEEWGIVHTHTAPNTWTQVTGCVVAHVNKGDDVFVKTSGSSSGLIYSDINGKTSFSGWKIDY
ncbi:multimerin-2-like [Saccostrea cucullata]|uniref:multimerin-2-like n=1 Tax=Saccostrea cuccullata TaxID=36930 RepID=UPI002ED49D93